MSNLHFIKNRPAPGILFLACGMAWVIIFVGLFFTPLGQPNYRTEFCFRTTLSRYKLQEIDASPLASIDHLELLMSERNINNALQHEPSAQKILSLSQFAGLTKETIAYKLKISLAVGEDSSENNYVSFTHVCGHERKKEESQTILSALFNSYKRLLIEEEKAILPKQVARSKNEVDANEPYFFTVANLGVDEPEPDYSGLYRIMMLACLASLLSIPALVFFQFNGKRQTSPLSESISFVGPGQHDFGEHRFQPQPQPRPQPLVTPPYRGVGFVGKAVQLALFTAAGVFISILWNAYSSPIYESTTQFRVSAKPELNLSSIEADDLVNSVCAFKVNSRLEDIISVMLGNDESLICTLDQFKKYRSSPEEVTSISVFSLDKSEQLKQHLLENLQWIAKTDNPGIVSASFTSQNPGDSELVLKRLVKSFEKSVEMGETCDIDVISPPSLGQKVSRSSVKSTVAFGSIAFLIGAAFLLLRRYSPNARMHFDTPVKINMQSA